MSFCEFGEKELLAPIEKLLKKPIPVVEGHPYPMEVFEAPKRDKHGKIVNADDQEARQAARERKKAREEVKRTSPQSLPPHGGKVAPVSPAPDEGSHRKNPQPSASIKKQAGYRASKTLDQALSAMSPKSHGPAPKPSVKRGETSRQPKSKSQSASRDSAFEAWLAEERAIQARQYGQDPLAGEEIMDATARFLAPKGEHSRIGELGLERGRAKGRLRPGDQSESEGKRPGHAAVNASQTQLSPRVHPPAAPRQEKPRRDKASQKGGQERNSLPRKNRTASSSKPLPKQGSPAPKQSRQDKRRPDRPRRGPVEAPHSGAQKDSTEQRSLMKPYYFNPNED